MGLDVKFRLLPAVQAGLELTVFIEQGHEETDTAERLCHCIRLPGELAWRDIYPICEDGIMYAAVRANKWGNFYQPLTDLLRENDIPWEEY